MAAARAHKGTRKAPPRKTAPAPDLGALPEGAREALRALGGHPDDEGLRERAARMVAQAGQEAAAIGVLLERLVNLTAHERGPLPCLCRACLDPAQGRATKRGMVLVRQFTVVKGRVLFFWMPEDLQEEAGEVCHAVGAALRGSGRLGGKR